MRTARPLTFLMLLGLLAGTGCSEAPSPPAEPAEPAVPVAPASESAAPATVKNDPEVFNFEGFGPAKFGADEEHVRMAWGHPLEAGTPAEGATCYQLFMDPAPEDGKGIRFLFEDGKFARYDVDVARHVAPGDIAVGASAEAVLEAFPGRVESQPHKYVEGARNLVVSPADGGAARLVFEVDPAGIVSAWHIGVPPQVYYVEGCG